MKKEKVLNLLKRKNVKPSVQRMEILNYIVENKNHPSVDEIYSHLNKKIATLSKTTIYNTLKILCKKNILTEILIEEDEVRFDYMEKPHIHFKCKSCNKIYDVFKKCPLINCKKIEGHKIEEYHIYLIGTCKNCYKDD
ncbi:MAG: transcriptional repressor [bacterium]|nr:transcriptional repressor [bacterium]